MSIITKQLILNEIQLPTDVINIIKEFCFVNIEEVTKKNKLKINVIIRSAILSTYEDDDAFWFFELLLDENEYGEKFELRGHNCLECGNYGNYFCKSYNNYLFNLSTCTCWEKNKIIDNYWKYPLSEWI